jgi:DNA-binding MarR family transcriptional regulator
MKSNSRTSSPMFELDKSQNGEPIEQVAYKLLAKCAAKFDAELNRLFRPYELTSATYGILTVLEGAGDVGQSCGDISTQLVAEVPDMTRLLDRLERLDYVKRERSTADRRMIKVTITAKAKNVLDIVRQPVRDFHIRHLGHLGGRKLGELAELLNLLLGPEQSIGTAISSESLSSGHAPTHHN